MLAALLESEGIRDPDLQGGPCVGPCFPTPAGMHAIFNQPHLNPELWCHQDWVPWRSVSLGRMLAQSSQGPSQQPQSTSKHHTVLKFLLYAKYLIPSISARLRSSEWFWAPG